ncbi:Hypothetical protein, putative [Bodo saltans]|uniref:Uncharacterized protein n=1 Tax=Bodo saltans TaxID=75058 RepID=A0A0S4IYT2_BODSA|nr:Hypothetical protein, putative [Bodo saltans]|eukprot:CUG54982.1 Hypothetical protein, putative [Bodo saltans]
MRGRSQLALRCVCSAIHWSRVHCSSSISTTLEVDEGRPFRDNSSNSEAESLPPVPPHSFEVMYEPGTRRFTLIGTSPVTSDSVVVHCDVNQRAMPRLTWDSTYGKPSPQPRSSVRRQRGMVRRSISKHLALPTHSPDELPIQFRAFVGSAHRPMCMELRLMSLDGLLGIDGVVMHPGGVVRSSIVDMPLSKLGSLYQGPHLTQVHLAATMTSTHRQSINPLVPYRQALLQYADRFVNPKVCPFSRFNHHPVHTAPGRVTDALAAFAKDVGVDDELALFVHQYALYVQNEEDDAWLPRVDAALGGLLPASRELQRHGRRLTR